MTDATLAFDGIEIRGDELRVGYVFANRSAAPIYLYNLIQDRHAQLGRAPSSIPTPQLAQTCLLEPSTALMLLGPTPPPNYGPGVSSYGTPRPFLSRVLPGEAAGATIRAKLPLAEWSESCEPLRTGDRLVQVTITTLRLVADYVREADVEWIDEHPEIRGCFDLGAREVPRVQVEQAITQLGVVMLADPQMFRFS